MAPAVESDTKVLLKVFSELSLIVLADIGVCSIGYMFNYLINESYTKTRLTQAHCARPNLGYEYSEE